MTTALTARKKIRRNAHRRIAALRASHTVAHAYTLDNYFSGEVLSNAAWPWEQLEKYDFAELFLEADGSATIRLHSNCWYTMRLPQ